MVGRSLIGTEFIKKLNLRQRNIIIQEFAEPLWCKASCFLKTSAGAAKSAGGSALFALGRAQEILLIGCARSLIVCRDRTTPRRKSHVPTVMGKLISAKWLKKLKFDAFFCSFASNWHWPKSHQTLVWNCDTRADLIKLESLLKLHTNPIAQKNNNWILKISHIFNCHDYYTPLQS